MTKIEVESFSTVTNAAVIRLPGRKFAGVVVQGDSLRIMVDLLTEIGRLSGGSGDAELEGAISELHGVIGSYIMVYEQTLREHGEPFPYPER